MTRIGLAALLAAVLASAYSIAEAIATPIIGHPIVDPDRPGLAVDAVGVVLVLTFILCVAVLLQQSARIDARSSFRRWVRRLLLADLTILATTFSIGFLIERIAPNGTAAKIMENVGSIAFILMFLLGAALGWSLIRCPDLRAGARCLASIAALIPLTILVGTLLPGWAHAAYAETALYIGTALLANQPKSQHDKTNPHVEKSLRLNDTTAV